MPIPASCPMCGSSRDQFKVSRKTGRAKCPTCGEIFEPDEDYESSALPPPTRRFEEDGGGRRRGGGRAAAADRVKGPAIYMIVVGVLGTLLVMVSLGVRTLTALNPNPPGAARQAAPGRVDPNSDAYKVGQVGGAVVSLCLQLVMLIGGMKMLKLESPGLCRTAAILCCIPCCNGTLLFAIPGGIWALVVLSEPEVKAAFR